MIPAVLLRPAEFQQRKHRGAGSQRGRERMDQGFRFDREGEQDLEGRYLVE